MRVEARRLRARLEEDYAGPGAADSIRIVIPRGGYSPTFEPVTAGEAPLAGTGEVVQLQTPGSPPAAPAHSMTMVVIGAVLMFLVIGAISRIGPPRLPAAQASAGPAIAVLPLQHYSAVDADSLTAARLTDAITTELARLRTLAVASRTSSTQFSSETGAIAAIRGALHVDFVMEGSAVNDNGTVSVTIRVVDATRDRKVWVGQYKSTPGEIASLATRIAREASEGTLAYHARTASDR